jgi:hypothetical protein
MSNDVWVCSQDASHTCTSQEAEKQSYFCPKCPYGESILINTGAGASPGPGSGTGTSPGYPLPVVHQEDLGLAIILLDCSGSMNEPPFPNHPTTKKDLIARSVAAGVFSLSGNPLKEFAYVMIVGFDHEIDIILPYTSIQTIVNTYKQAEGLEKMIKSKMLEKNGATDINGVLKVAFNFTQQFINSEISALGNYKPRIQAVLDDNMKSHLVPNVRVLLFTDGEHYLGDHDQYLQPSPFKNLSFNHKVCDLLMSAYYGKEGEKGYQQLKSLVSKCPRHPSTDQFFLFDEPSKVANLKGLFRMASGASGFCPTCLAEANSVTRDN